MTTGYKKLRKLGSGGFGEVWMAERATDKRTFAIKYLLDTAPDSVERFKREVRCLSQLDHPNIVRVVSKRLLTEPFFYVMQPYKGSLYDGLAAITGDHTRIYQVFRSVLDAVRYAHSEGIIHRDLKPENVLMNSDTDLAVSDFGLGRILDSKSTRQTTTGVRLGTFMYCAPEQMRDFKSADARSDVFSLGRMLYELYTGELTSAIQDLSAIPASIAPIVEKATAGKPDDRYQTVEKMLEDFDSTMEIILGIVDADSLDNLIEKLRAKDSWTDEEVIMLTNALEEIRSEPELVHTALMKVPPKLFAVVAIRSHALARTLVKAFSKHAESQGWPFSYTDSIADVSEAIFNEVSDSEMRADLFRAVLRVGIGHSRWHVIGVAGGMAITAQTTNDVAAISRVLKDYPDEAKMLTGYVTRSKLHPSLRQYFPKEETD